MRGSNWIRVLDAHEVTRERPRTVKPDGKQIVIFRTVEPDGEEALHAIDNRCPHEGYPLSTGMLSGGVLTCEWHNWKFRLCDGVCVLGGEDVRSYPLRIDDGGIWLDITDPPNEALKPALYRSLEDAFDDDDWGWAGRATERLLALGEAPETILGWACDWAAHRAPYGFDHGLATAADLAALMTDGEGAGHGDAAARPAPVVPLLEAMNLMVEPNLRRPIRELGPAEAVARPRGGDGRAAEAEAEDGWRELGAELGRRIEAEELAGAEGLLRGALAAGAGPEQVFAWLTCAATEHFLGYGHAHIYCVKAEELLQRIGWEHAHPVLTSLVSSIVFDTREDKLPYMREYRKLMDEYRPRMDAWAAATPDGTSADTRVLDELLAAVLESTLESAFSALARALDAGIAHERLALTLAVAAGHRLLRFDARLEASDEISEGWLSITHALTHADAVRETVRRRPGRAALRALFQSARFIQHLAPCDAGDGGDTRAAQALLDDQAGHGADQLASFEPALMDALREHRAADAMALVRACHAHAHHVLVRGLERAVLADRATVPIFVAHHIKTTMAALRLTRGLADDPVLSARDDRLVPLLGAVRFLAHPLQERRIARRARVARAFVREGRMQKKLLGY